MIKPFLVISKINGQTTIKVNEDVIKLLKG